MGNFSQTHERTLVALCAGMGLLIAVGVLMAAPAAPPPAVIAYAGQPQSTQSASLSESFTGAVSSLVSNVENAVVVAADGIGAAARPMLCSLLKCGTPALNI